MTSLNIKSKIVLLVSFFIFISLLISVIYSSISTSQVYLEYEINSIKNARDFKKKTIATYIETKKDELLSLSKSRITSDFFSSLNAVTEIDLLTLGKKDKFPIDHRNIKELWGIYGTYFNEVLKEKSYYDIFFLHKKHGYVMYTVTKESDLGENLVYGGLSKSGLGVSYNKTLKRNRLSFSDLAPYVPSNLDPAIFLSAPVIIDDETIGILAIQLNVKLMNKVMSYREGYSKTQHDFMVGQDFKMRSNHHFKKTHSLENSFKNPLQGSIRLDSVKKALNKEKGIVLEIHNNQDIEIAYDYIQIDDGIVWAIISQINTSEIADKIFDSVLFSVLISIINIIIIIFIFSLVINSIIIKPLDSLKDGLNDFFDYLQGKRDKAKEIDIHSKDEFGLMSKTINKNIRLIEVNIEKDKKFISSIKHITNNIKNGDFKEIIESDANNPNLLELKDIINGTILTIRKSLHISMDTLSEYSKDNYTHFVDSEDLNGDLKKLGDDITGVGNTISNMLTLSKSNSITLKDLSHNLNDNVHKLTNNNTIQNENIDEINTSIKSIIDNITDSSKLATKIELMSQDSKSISSIGKQLAKETLGSMDDINDKINNIFDSIASIDKISFQTKILSLNASVEAATVGEEGKGFAVVASEVRTLAGRSSKVSNEIKDLVSEAIQKANYGKEISNKMIDKFNTLDNKINTTFSLIQMMTDASKKQLEIIDNISQSMSSLHDKSQDNSNSVDDTNKISEQMIEISETINKEISSKSFKDNS